MMLGQEDAREIVAARPRDDDSVSPYHREHTVARPPVVTYERPVVEVRRTPEEEALAYRFSFETETRQHELGRVETYGVVTDILGSAFAGRLETLLRQRASGPDATPPPRQAQPGDGVAPPQGQLPGQRRPARWERTRVAELHGSGVVGGHALRQTNELVRALQHEVSELRQALNVCLDMQSDIQRAVRQEIAGALRVAAQADSTVLRTTSVPVASGQCCVCSDSPCDAALYRCGHNATCHGCALQLKARGHVCPICRAEIVDVVHLYTASA